MSFFLLIALAACSDQVSILTETAACEDYNFVDPEVSSVELTQEGEDIHISHTGVFQGCDDLFRPEVEASGKVIFVREFWESRTEDDCELCFAPTIIIEAPPPGSYEVGWYEGDANVALEVLAFDVE